MNLVTSARPRCALAGLALAALLLAPTSAGAGTETLSRSFSNMIGGPVDMGLSPITAGMVQYRNMKNVEDSPGVRVFYAVPGYVWLFALHLGASALRTTSGLLELIPGLVLLPFKDTELDPLFAPADRGEAIIWDFPNAVMDVRLGIDYTAAPF